MKKIYTYLLLAVGVAGLSGCNGDDIDYDNSIFFNEAEIANEAASKNSFDSVAAVLLCLLHTVYIKSCSCRFRQSRSFGKNH